MTTCTKHKPRSKRTDPYSDSGKVEKVERIIINWEQRRKGRQEAKLLADH